MRRFLKWVSICCLAIGSIIGGIGLLKGGLNNADFLYWLDFVESINIFSIFGGPI